MPLTRRLVKGAELTLAEGDANLDTLEAAAAAALAAANAASAAAATKYLKPGGGVPIADMNATELAEYIRDTIAAALVAGTNVTVTVNDAGDTITISAAGGGGAGVTDGDKGDIVVSSAGGIWTIDPAVLSSAGRAVTSAADAAAQRTALGLGTAATQATGAFATAAQGAKADAALQTAPVTSVAGKTGVVTLTQADVTANASAAISNATTLNAATHANRQLVYSGSTATLAISNDGTGGWDGDAEILIQTAAGSAGVPTLTTPDGKNVTGSVNQPIGAKRKGANSWDVFLLPQTNSGGGASLSTISPTQHHGADIPAMGQNVTSTIGLHALTTNGSVGFAAIGGTIYAQTPRLLIQRPTSVINQQVNRATNQILQFGLAKQRFVISSGINDALGSTAAYYMGITSSPGMWATSAANPSVAGLGFRLGIGFDVGDTNVSLYTAPTSGAATKTSLGASFPVPATAQAALYRFEVKYFPSADAGGQRFEWIVTDLVSGASASGTHSGGLVADTATQLFSIGSTRIVTAAAGIPILDHCGIYAGLFTQWAP